MPFPVAAAFLASFCGAVAGQVTGRALVKHDLKRKALRARVEVADALAAARQAQAAGAATVAEATAHSALAHAEKELGPTDPETIAAIILVRALLRERGCPEKADALFTPVADPHAITLAAALHRRGCFEEAEVLTRRALASAALQDGAGVGLRTLICLNNLGKALHMQGHLEEAARMHRMALAGFHARNGDDSAVTVLSAINLAKVLCDEGHFDEAENLFEGVHARTKGVVGMQALAAEAEEGACRAREAAKLLAGGEGDLAAALRASRERELEPRVRMYIDCRERAPP